MQWATVVKTNRLLLISHLLADQQIADAALSSQGYDLSTVSSGYAGLRLVYETKPDLIMLDLAMPDIAGEQLCQRIRNFTDTPILFLAESQPNLPLSTGATACLATQIMTRPLCPTTLLTCVQQALASHEQRQPTPMATDSRTPPVELVVDHQQCQVMLNHSVHQLSATEYRLLRYFLDNLGRTLSHQQLEEAMSGAMRQDHSHHIQTLISRLRRKIEPDPQHPHRVLSHYGMGYSFVGKGLIELNR